jgi:hypothetical protein
MADHVFRQSDLERSAWLILANHQAKERLNLPMLKQPSMDSRGLLASEQASCMANHHGGCSEGCCKTLGPTQCPSQCSGLYQIKVLPFAASADLHDHLATNLNCVRLDRFRLFVAQQRNGFANLLRNVAASTTPKPRAEICISPSSLRNSTRSSQHSFNYCFRWIFTRSVLKADFY